MSHWSSGLPICFPSQGTWVQNPWGVLWETGILLLALSRYIGDPDVIDHFCGLVSRRASSWTITRSSCWQCDNSTWSHTALLSWFHARCRSPFRLHNRWSRLLGGGSPVGSLQSHFILTMSHWSSRLPVCFPSQETRVQNPWGVLCETGILLLALSCYNIIQLIYDACIIVDMVMQGGGEVGEYCNIFLIIV